MNVVVHGRQTPVVLEERGPNISEREIKEFETRLGYQLPSDYREFLLRYNGGSPRVGIVNGRDDDPDVPYQHGDFVRMFLELPPANGSVENYELRAPAEIPWDLPGHILPIAEDSFGNYFVMELGKNGCIRFLDHESLDEPVSRHRIMADSFLDLLLRFRTMQEQEEIDRAQYSLELNALEAGKFPPDLDSQCYAAEERFPEIRQWIRSLCVSIFKEKGHFSVHADPKSRLLLDVAFWLNQNGKAPGTATKRTELATIIMGWHQEDEDGFGLNGYAPDFLHSWWEDRLATGMLEGTQDAARLKKINADKIIQALREMFQEEV
jgi:hypothetical protein